MSKRKLQSARLEIIEMMSVSFQRNYSALSVGGGGGEGLTGLFGFNKRFDDVNWPQ